MWPVEGCISLLVSVDQQQKSAAAHFVQYSSMKMNDNYDFSYIRHLNPYYTITGERFLDFDVFDSICYTRKSLAGPFVPSIEPHVFGISVSSAVESVSVCVFAVTSSFVSIVITDALVLCFKTSSVLEMSAV